MIIDCFVLFDRCGLFVFSLFVFVCSVLCVVVYFLCVAVLVLIGVVCGLLFSLYVCFVVGGWLSFVVVVCFVFLCVFVRCSLFVVRCSLFVVRCVLFVVCCVFCLWLLCVVCWCSLWCGVICYLPFVIAVFCFVFCCRFFFFSLRCVLPVGCCLWLVVG